MTEVCDVGIVGFGPAGATLAALLAKRGCRVSVFDKHRDIYPKPRAIGMDHEAMRIFQRVGLSDALDKNSIPYNPTVYLGTDGEPIQRIEITPPPNPLSWPPTSTFDQPALEEALRKHVAEQDNVAIFLENEIVDCCEADGQVNLAARAKDGSTQTFSAKYVVASDGAESSIRRRLGISLEDLEFEEDWIVADVIVNEEAIETLPKTNVQYCDPRRPTTFVICPGRHRRFELRFFPARDLRATSPRTFCIRFWRPGCQATRRVFGGPLHIASKPSLPSNGAKVGCCWQATRRISCRRFWAKVCARAFAMRPTSNGSSRGYCHRNRPMMFSIPIKSSGDHTSMK